MKKLILLALIGFLSIKSFAQVPGCSTPRYILPIFQGVDVTTVKYATVTNYFGQPEDLMMDVYTPSGDTDVKRPVVIVAHGGVFIFGHRSNMEPQCRALASLGYVAVSISYRLYPILLGFPNEPKFLQIALNAAADMKGAIRYMRGNFTRNDDFKIDTNFIFIGGYSAGAVMATHVAYLDDSDAKVPLMDSIINATPRGLQGTTGDPSDYVHSTKVSGVLNLAGALYDANYISSGEAPLFSLHGDADETVPYAAGLAFGVPLQGSSLLEQRAAQVGLSSHFLVTIPGGLHADPVSGAASQTYRDQFAAQAAVAMKEIMCGPGGAASSALPPLPLEVFPNPANQLLHLNFGEMGDYSITILNTFGQKVDQFTQNDQSGVIELKDWPKGIYFLQAINKNNNQKTTKKIVVE